MKNYQKIAAYCHENWPKEAAHIIHLADMAAEQTYLFDLPWDMERTSEPVHFEGEIDWLYRPGIDPEFSFQFNRHRFFICLTQAYHLTGDEKYVRVFLDQLLDWIKKNPLNPKSDSWRTLETGIRGDYWTKALSMIAGSPLLSPEDHQIIKAALGVHRDYLIDTDTPPKVRSNWSIFEARGLLAIGLYMNEPETIRLAIERLERNLSYQVAEDGCHWEQSQSYHNEVFQCSIDAIHTAHQAGFSFSEGFLDCVHRMAYANVMWKKPNQCQPAGGDSDEVDLRDVLTHGAYLFSDPVLKFAGFDKMDFEGVWDFGEDSIEQYAALPSAAPADTSFAMDDSGHYILRSGWDTDADYFQFRCGFLGGGHGHSDQLHIDAVFNGEDILIDPGRYTYTETPEREAYKSLMYHNAPSVDGVDCTDYMDSWTTANSLPGGSGQMRHIGEYTYFSGINHGYYRQGVSVRRQIAAIGTRHYIIIDTFFGAGSHTYTQNFTFNNMGTVSADGNRLTYTGQNTAARLTVLTEGAQIQIHDRQISKRYNEQFPSKAAEISVKTDGFCVLTTILSRLDAEQPSIKRLPIYAHLSGLPLAEAEGIAFEITEKQQSYTVLCSWKESPALCDILCANGHKGMGQLQIFKTGQGETQRTVLVR